MVLFRLRLVQITLLVLGPLVRIIKIKLIISALGMIINAI